MHTNLKKQQKKKKTILIDEEQGRKKSMEIIQDQEVSDKEDIELPTKEI